MKFFEDKFDGEVHSVESFLKSWVTGSTAGAGIHYGTWESAVHGLAHASDLKDLRKELFKERLPISDPKLKPRPLVHKNELVNRWCLPFPGSDRPVVLRSQRFRFENEKKRPIQMQTYVQFHSLLHVIGILVFGAIFGILTKFSFGRKLLLDHPKLFSLGFFSHEGPSEDTMEKTKFSITFYGQGWPSSEKLAEPTDVHTTAPTKKLVTRVTGTNPGYGATCVALLLSATTILKEKEKLPANGGVIPPGGCFAKTNIIENLSKHGFKFEVISVDGKDDVKTIE